MGGIGLERGVLDGVDLFVLGHWRCSESVQRGRGNCEMSGPAATHHFILARQRNACSVRCAARRASPGIAECYADAFREINE
jgi:hypothetical protein